MELKGINFFLWHKDSMDFYKKKWMELSDIVKNTVFLLSKKHEKQVAWYTRTWVYSLQ
jgi:hypothetical protein